MIGFLKRFHREEAGAVTIDWVVLTAAMATFGLVIFTIIADAAQDPTEGLGARLAQQTIN